VADDAQHRIAEFIDNWKFSAADVLERESFDDYRKAMSETLSHVDRS
jgi:polyphosphate kinase 2 (PPK2 family)